MNTNLPATRNTRKTQQKEKSILHNDDKTMYVEVIFFITTETSDDLFCLQCDDDKIPGMYFQERERGRR